MTNKLHMDTSAANLAVQELNNYLNDATSLFEKHLKQPYLAIINSKTAWRAGSRMEFSEDCIEKVQKHETQKQILSSLISDLQKEIRQWEDTAQQLGG